MRKHFGNRQTQEWPRPVPRLTYVWCSDALLANKKFVRVDLQDLHDFDAQLERCVAENPTEYLPVVRPLRARLSVLPLTNLHPQACCVQLEAAALRQLQQFHIQEEDGEEQTLTSVQVLLHSSRNFGPGSIRQLVVRWHAQALLHVLVADRLAASVSDL